MIVKIKNRKWKEHLKGGKADGKKPSDYDRDDINIGSKIEREHSNQVDIEEEIAMDHEEENDTYYDELIMSGIADEKDAIDTFDRLKTDNDKKNAINKIQKHLNKEKEKLGMKENHFLKFDEFINKKLI